MYKNRVRYKNPGLLIIMVDQTEVMNEILPKDNRSMAEVVSGGG